MSSIAGLLRQTLDNLNAKDLKRFKALLRDRRLFPQGTLKNSDTDVDDVVDLIVQAFPDQKATRMVMAILNEMKQNGLAAELKQEWSSRLSKGNLKRPQDKNSCENKPAVKRRFSSVRHELQSLLKNRFCRVHDRTVCDLQDIYTELYIVKGRNGWVNNTHEVIRLESCHNCGGGQSVNLANMFQKYSHESRPVSKVLTVGIAGSGKTIAVQKFVIDWAERKTNQDIDLVFVLLFRELNMRKCQRYSLVDLLLLYHPGLNELANAPEFKEGKILFIFDGLDESNLVLDFARCDVDKPTLRSSVDMVIASLLQGILLPSALVWVTTRPASANLIRHFHLETEIRGFNDPQKDEYFHKVIKDKDQAKKIIAHVKSKRSLHIMCHIPVFCSITVSVLGEMLNSHSKERLPQTLTEMYAFYVAFQIKQMNVKYTKDKEELRPEDKQGLLFKLGKLAFSHLAENKLIFYQEDLRACEIDVTKASVHSGLCTQIFNVDSYCTDEDVYSFVHLSIQEFLAAFYVLHTFTTKRENVLVENCWWTRIVWKIWSSSYHLHKVAVDMAILSQNGHWDLFLRFLLGLAPVVERKGVLSKLLPKLNDEKVCSSKTIDYIKRKIREELSPDRIINLFHCLSELGDDSLVEEINSFRSSEADGWNLTPAQCSALAYLLLMSAEDMEEFDLKKYLRSEEGLYRMLPVVKVSRRVWLNECHLSKASCDRVASVLEGTASLLRELDMSDNDLKDEGVELICAGLQNPNCKLETLKLSGCLVTEKGYGFLASALKLNPSYLKELDLSYNHSGETGIGALTTRQKDADCKLKIFNYSHGGKIRMKPGLQKYACVLTLDPNTAHRQLHLSDGNKRVSWTERDEPYPEHPDRFKVLQQVLCSEGLVEERFYWEVEYTGEIHIGVTYKSDSEFSSTVIGHNAVSWSLERSKDEYITWHVDKIKVIPYPLSGQQRIGVYLDCLAGTLSFYAIQSNLSTHLYTFNGNNLTKPLYPAFWLNWDASLNLCSMIEAL